MLRFLLIVAQAWTHQDSLQPGGGDVQQQHVLLLTVPAAKIQQALKAPPTRPFITPAPRMKRGGGADGPH